MSNYQIWCQNLLDFWQQKEITKIVGLFSEDVIYYEEPNHQISYNDLEEVWTEIKNQDTTNLQFKILVEENNKCVANFLLKGEKTYDMIYEIELNEENMCRYFKQWYMEY